MVCMSLLVLAKKNTIASTLAIISPRSLVAASDFAPKFGATELKIEDDNLREPITRDHRKPTHDCRLRQWSARTNYFGLKEDYQHGLVFLSLSEGKSSRSQTVFQTSSSLSLSGIMLPRWFLCLNFPFLDFPMGSGKELVGDFR